MLNPKGLSNLLLFSTVRIETEYPDGMGGTGTGFFFRYPIDENTHLKLVITNKHVVEGTSASKFQLHTAGSDGKNVFATGEFVTVVLDQFDNNWITHPDPNVDLCALNFTPELVQEKNQWYGYVSQLQPEMILPKDDLRKLRTIEEIIMVGYPNGIWDDASHYPLIRRGITSIHPGLNFKGQNIGVIDAACFPGSSGSPIYVLNNSAYSDKENLVDLENREILLGVLYAGAEMTVNGDIGIVEIPNQWCYLVIE